MDSSHLDSFVNMALAQGVRFATREDAAQAKILLRTNGVVTSEIQLFTCVGEHLKCEVVPEALRNGLTKEVVERLLELMARAPQESIPPMCKLLRLACEYDSAAGDFHWFAELVARESERVDDLIVLATERLLRGEVIGELLESPGLLSALSLAAARELFGVWESGDGSLLEFARAFSQEIRERNAQEALEHASSDPEPVGDAVESLDSQPQFDHTQLGISRFVSPRSPLSALQAILVFGVIQPEVAVSNMFNGSQVQLQGFEDRVLSHATRLGFSRASYESALQFLMTIRVLEGGKKTGRIRFERNPHGHERGRGIVNAVLALATTIQRPK